ncbi:aminomethyl-transferring glycine dehydrogenase subunit GcvPA [Candidatus Woesearchaeota archaeon]|nr:aminomethyl-transferring glycine dehydrogenase subunit GcvPA [Candidatus Woesearchaeota archaeon]
MGNQFIGSTEAEQKEMLAALGFGGIDGLFDAVVPAGHQRSGSMKSLSSAKTEQDVEALLRQLASQNTAFKPSDSFIGAGHYQRVIPKAVAEVVLRGEWMTPYTPYQPEVSQGILYTLFDFQSIMAELTGMAVVNAGLYHGVNAVVEGALMACRITGKDKVLVSEAVHPVAVRNLETYLAPAGKELVTIPANSGVTAAESIEKLVDDQTAVVIVQNPNFWGLLDGMDGHAEAAHAKGALYMAAGLGDQLSLALLKKPSDYGADIYAGEGQHFGVPVGYGGPHVGVLGIADGRHVRQLPGRLVIQAEDVDGKKGAILGLVTREQHIRRERATSNACTAETLVAVMSVAYAAVMGPKGLRAAAEQSYSVAHYIAAEISKTSNFRLLHPDKPFFNEFAVATPVPAATIVDRRATEGVLAGVPIARAFPFPKFQSALFGVAAASKAFPPSRMHSAADYVLLTAATEANSSLSSLHRTLSGLGYRLGYNKSGTKV